MLPRVVLDGRVVAEPELRFGQTGKAVARLRVVSADRRRDDAGNWVDGDTCWLDVTVFGQLAENVCESVVKGDLVVIQGKLRTEEWQDRDSGQKRSKTSMIADAIGPSLQFRKVPHGNGQSVRSPEPVRDSPAPREDYPPF